MFGLHFLLLLFVWKPVPIGKNGKSEYWVQSSHKIKFLTKEGANAKEIHWRMADVYGDSSPKYSTVAKWSAEFKRGRDSLEDNPRPGRPADVISQEMIDCVERLVLNNSRIKVAELASECGISNGSVYTIIHEHLGMSKVSARWVPRNLNMQDGQQRVESSQELLEVYNATRLYNRRWILASPLGPRFWKRVHAMEVPWLTPT